MLNGRRLAPSGVGNSVDVNTVPRVLVDRVEIIAGTATTVTDERLFDIFGRSYLLTLQLRC
jgi:hypothetical protein